MSSSFRHVLIGTALLLLVSSYVRTASAAAFALQLQSASSSSSAYAGSATEADDISNMWENPALLSWVEHPLQLVFGANYIVAFLSFHDRGSVAPQSPEKAPYKGQFAGHWRMHDIVPNLMFAFPVNDRVRLGFSIIAPFGLETNYGEAWAGRFFTKRSKVFALDLSPSIAVKVTNRLSVGLGVDWQYFDATLSQDANLSPAIKQDLETNPQSARFIAPGTLCKNESTYAKFPIFGQLVPYACSKQLWIPVQIRGSDYKLGWHAGMVYNFPNNRTRIGMDYHSPIHFRLNGTVHFGLSNVPEIAALIQQLSPDQGPNSLKDRAAHVSVEVPGSYHFGILHKVTPQWDLLFDALYTKTSSIQSLDITDDSGQVIRSLVLKWRNTWLFSTGLQYHYSERWTWRTGVYFDQGAYRNEHFRTPRLPDNNKYGIAGGFGYRMNDHVEFDAGLWLIHVNRAPVDTGHAQDDIINNGIVLGDVKTNLLNLSMQVVYRF